MKIQYDRCVNRNTHIACSNFRFTAIKKPCAFLVSTPQECEENGYSWNYTSNSCENPTPTPTPAPTPTPPDSGDGCPDFTLCEEPEVYDTLTCSCVYPSPIIIDVAGDGFRLTAAREGVLFDINADGRAERVAWTESGTDDAWLALDRDGNVDKRFS